MFTQKSNKIFHSVQERRPFSVFQNLVLGKASTDDKCHFALVSLFSEFRPRKNSTNPKCHLTISWGTSCQYINVYENFITIFHSVQEKAPLSLFQNFVLGKASTDKKFHFAICWARSCQCQCLRKSLSKYSTQFKR